MGYRDFYQKKTKRKLPQHIEIHHIDHNRKNPDIYNLVALPSKLHTRYHQLYPHFMLEEKHLQLPLSNTGAIDLEVFTGRLQEFIRIRQECIKWVNYRNYLLGIEHKKYKDYSY